MLVNRLGGFVAPFLAIYLTSVRHRPVEEAGLIVLLGERIDQSLRPDVDVAPLGCFAQQVRDACS